MKPPSITTPNMLFRANARYKAPIFQRYYVWGKKEWASLVEDLDTADPLIGQFLGAIVLKDLGRSAGPASPTSYLLIDGQQRITTLYLLLLSLAAHAKDMDDGTTATFIWKNYLVEDSSPAFHGWPKVVPTLQDRHSFYHLLTTALPDMQWNFSADPEDKKPRISKRLHNQWSNIQRHVRSVGGIDPASFDKGARDALLTTIQDHLKLIDITLEADDDANATFSRLNAKGVPLELADLVRNEVFSKFGPKESEKADKFFYQSWQPFEKTLPEGSLSAFFPVYAYIVLRGKVTKAAAFGELQRVWKKKDPRAVLLDVQKYSKYFNALSTFSPLSKLSQDVNAQVERLSRMPRTRVTWPFIIEVLRAVHDSQLLEKDALRSLRIVESFLVRRALVGREPTGLHAVFKVLWDRTKGKPKEVLSKIVTRTILSPSDTELRAFLVKERSDSRQILGFLLEEYDREFVRTKKYDPPPTTAATIEHIMPKSLTPAWLKDFSPAEHERCVGLLGNLAPLSESQNKSLQDQSWVEKRKRFRGSNFKSTQSIAANVKWTSVEIGARTSELIDWIVETWPQLETI